MKDKTYRVLLKMYDSRFLKRFFNRYIDHEGGQFESETLRRLYSDRYKVSIGHASYGCFDPRINFGSPIAIGNYCSFAANIHFIPGNHPPTDVSTHPYFHRAEFGYVESRKNDGGENFVTTVGHDVWIGRDVIVLPKCKRIGNGAIIGAGSVVTHDVEPYSIVAGNPAREIRKRFSDEQIKRLEESEWFLLPPKRLSSAFQYAQDVERFLEEVKRIKEDD